MSMLLKTVLVLCLAEMTSTMPMPTTVSSEQRLQEQLRSLCRVVNSSIVKVSGGERPCIHRIFDVKESERVLQPENHNNTFCKVNLALSKCGYSKLGQLKMAVNSLVPKNFNCSLSDTNKITTLKFIMELHETVCIKLYNSLTPKKGQGKAEN